MGKRSGLTRGDRRRNERIEAVRAVVRLDRAILAIDLGEDKQVAALMDHDGRVLGRRTVAVKAYGLGPLLEWSGGQAAAAGFVGVVVACEPTGHRWRSVMALADQAEMGFVCAQPFRVHLAREADDYTRDRTDYKDSVLIGKLVSRLDCYLPERADERWARLRHLGQRRFGLVTRIVGCGQQIIDLLSCCWPAALSCAARPLEATTWLACLAATVERCHGEPVALRQLGRDGFLAAARHKLPDFGGKRAHTGLVNRFYDALGDQTGVSAQRAGGLERVHLLMDDWRSAMAHQLEVERRMVAVLDEMDLTELVTSIPGLSAVGAAAMLAETGDPARFASGRSVVKHAGLNPVENTSATFRGRTRVSRRGRPALRTAAWRAAWGAQASNEVLINKFIHLTTRERDRLTPGQARVACAATVLRWLYAVVTRREPWDPDRAAPRVHPARPA